MDAQAIQIGEPTVSGVSRRFAVPWRWSLVLFVALIAGHVGGSFLYGRFSDDLALGCSAFVVIALAGAAASWLVPNSETAHAGGGLLNPVPALLRTWREVSANRGLLYTVVPEGTDFTVKVKRAGSW